MDSPQRDPASDPQPDRSQPALSILLLASFLLVAGGQAVLTLPPADDEFSAFMLLGLGLIGVVLSVRTIARGGRPPQLLDRLLERAVSFLERSRGQVLLLAAAPILSYVATRAAGENPLMDYPWLAVPMWLLAIGLVIAGSWPHQSRPSTSRSPRWELALVLGIVAVAALTRLPNLDSIPWVLTGDEGFAGLTALEFLNGSRNNIFTTAWDSWPAFYLLLPALSIQLLGQSEFALRLPSALAGVAALLALYPFARAAFGRKVGLVAIAYMATFHFHIHFSRIGVHPVWDAFFFTLFTLTLWRAWKSGRRLDFALAGLVFGLSMHFYASARSLVVALPIWLTVAYFWDRDAFRRNRLGLVHLALATMVIILPLAHFYLGHPNELFAPYRRFSIFGSWLDNEIARSGLPAWRVLLGQFTDSALAFTGTNLRYWYEIDYPMLLPLPAALFLIGLVFIGQRLLRLPNLWLVLWLAAGAAAGALSESTPAAQRYVFTAPAVAIVVAVGLVRTWESAVHAWPRARRWIAVVAMTVLTAGAMIDAHFYFFEYTPSHSFADTNSLVADRAGRYLRQRPSEGIVYFLGPPRMGYSSHGSLPFLAPEHEGVDVTRSISDTLEDELDNPAIFIVLPERRDELKWIRERYQDGSLHSELAPDGELLFIAYDLQ